MEKQRRASCTDEQREAAIEVVKKLYDLKPC